MPNKTSKVGPILVTLIFISAFQFQPCLAQSSQPSQPEQAQITKLMPQPVPKSPNVAALGKFGDYQVSYFSGLPDISIPITEAKSGSLSVPVTLSYHPSGIKPTDVASWVGMGWALSAGGQVSRSVHGKADEELFYAGSLISDFSACNTTNATYIKNTALGINDTEPDVFSYSYPGKSGKFLLSQGGNPPYLIPYAPIIVSPTYVASPSAFTKFEITDETGVLHRFGKNAAGTPSTETSNAFNGGQQSINTSAWHLMESIAPNSNDQISYSYQDVGNSTMYDISYCITVQDQVYIQCDDPMSETCPKYPNPYVFKKPITSTTTANQQGLSTIIFKTGKVEFVLGAARLDQTGSNPLHTLDRINIYSLVKGSYILTKTVKFVYSYFTNALGGSGPLKLDAVQFLDNAAALVEQYKFTYATNSFSWNGTLPNFVNARDLWGYYNGALQNTDLIPAASIPYQATNVSLNDAITIGGALDRSPNLALTKEGSLARIDFPTGGFTQFEYESNMYDDNGVPAVAGGLRISRILSNDGTGAPPKIKTYKYGLGETGLGIANFSLNQFNYHSDQFLDGIACSGEVLQRMTYRSRSYYSNSAYSLDSFDSSPVCYPYVTEYFGDPTGSTIGKIIYEFDNLQPPTDNAGQVIMHSNKSFSNSFSWKRGKLTHKTTFDNANNKVAEDSIIYSVYQPTDKIVGLGAYQYNAYILQASAECKPGACNDGTGQWYRYSDYPFVQYSQSSGVMLETQKSEYSFEAVNTNHFEQKKTINVYDATKFQLTQSTVNRSNAQEQQVTVHRYPFQLGGNASSTGAAQGIYMLNSKNMVASPFETYSYLQNSDGSNQRIISGQLTTYRRNTANTNYVVPDQIYLWESSITQAKSTFVTSVVNGTNNGLTFDLNYKTRINMISYDSYGNLLSVSKTNDVPVSYQYGYNNALPTAEAKNAANGNGIKEFLYENFEESTLPGVLLSAGCHSGKYYLNGSYTTTFVPPNGRTYTLEYWYLSGGVWTFRSRAYTGSGMVLADGPGIDDVRIFPSDSQLKSYTYDPQLGITSVIDPNGLLHLYDYDSFGRLWRIRNDKGLIEKQYKYKYKGN